MPGMTTTEFDQPQLFAGEFPRRFMTVTIASGQQLAVGSVLGEVTASNEYKLAAAEAGDGSESPSVVLYEAVDTTDGAAPAEAVITGDLKASALTLGDGITLDAARKALRPLSLFIS